jgi:uncharacterized membrane protein YagU involved in acid resistance
MHPTRPKRRTPFRHGLLGGAIATTTMTGVFSSFDLIGWVGQLPPRQIMQRLLPDDTEPRQLNAATIVAHLAYGAALGGVFSLITRSPSTGRGALYGIAVCLANYEVGLPVAGIREPLHRDNPREIATLLIGHLVYGADLGRRLARRNR